MKKYIRSANKFTNKATQLVSKGFSDNYIAKRSMGSRKGESMEQITMNILNDPNITYGEEDKNGNQTLYYSGQNVGWINFRKGDGWIDSKAYNQVAKYKIPEDESYDDEDYYDYGDDVDACDNI